MNGDLRHLQIPEAKRKERPPPRAHRGMFHVYVCNLQVFNLFNNYQYWFICYLVITGTQEILFARILILCACLPSYYCFISAL
jgi:hypothetical protein